MAGSGGNMMAGIQTYGIGESGYGVMIGGFHGTTLEFNGRLEELKEKMPSFQDFVQIEENGYITFLAIHHERPTYLTHPLMASLRREPHKFFQELPRFLASTKAQSVHRMVLSGSLGSICLTLLYRPVSNDNV